MSNRLFDRGQIEIFVRPKNGGGVRLNFPDARIEEVESFTPIWSEGWRVKYMLSLEAYARPSDIYGTYATAELLANIEEPTPIYDGMINGY